METEEEGSQLMQLPYINIQNVVIKPTLNQVFKRKMYIQSPHRPLFDQNESARWGTQGRFCVKYSIIRTGRSERKLQTIETLDQRLERTGPTERFFFHLIFLCNKKNFEKKSQTHQRDGFLPLMQKLASVRFFCHLKN